MLHAGMVGSWLRTPFAEVSKTTSVWAGRLNMCAFDVLCFMLEVLVAISTIVILTTQHQQQDFYCLAMDQQD